MQAAKCSLFPANNQCSNPNLEYQDLWSGFNFILLRGLDPAFCPRVSIKILPFLSFVAPPQAAKNATCMMRPAFIFVPITKWYNAIIMKKKV